MKTKNLLIIPAVLLSITALSAIILSIPLTYADTSNASVKVGIACTMSGGGSYSDTVEPGTVKEISGSTISTTCNDSNGYSLYAIGYSGDSYDTPTNTQMIGANNIGNISTATSGNNSYWAMKLGAVTEPNPLTPPTIMNNFNDYHVIPETYTQIAKYTSSTASSSSTGASVKVTYKVSISNTQIAGTYNGKVEYAMVHPNNADAPTTPAPEMQSFTIDKCTATPRIVVDNRDGEEYVVAKLADRKCWMLDNLRLDITDSTILNSLTTANTHVNSASLISLKSGNRSAGPQYASGPIAQWDSNNTTNYYNRAQANAESKDTTTTSYGNGSGKIGVYYNYCAASAGSYCYDEGAGTGNASYDLCPANWRMPTGGSSSDSEYDALYTNGYSANDTKYKTALSTPLSGYFRGGSAKGQGSYGNFWSSTHGFSGNYMSMLYVYSSGAYPADRYNNRYDGISLRCLLDV